MNDHVLQLAIAVPNLLAKEGRYMEMGRRFRRGSSNIDVADLVIMLGIMAVVAALAWLIARYVQLREKRNTSSAQHLFQELCRAHQLDWHSRQLMQAVAKAHGLADPARVFVEPFRFDAAKLGPAFTSYEPQLAQLRRQLFAAPDDSGLADSE